MKALKEKTFDITDNAEFDYYFLLHYEDVKEAIKEILKYSNKKVVGENSYIQIPEKKFKEIMGEF